MLCAGLIGLPEPSRLPETFGPRFGGVGRPAPNEDEVRVRLFVSDPHTSDTTRRPVHWAEESQTG